MKKLALAAVIMGATSTAALSTPLFHQTAALTPVAEQVRIVCDEAGVCYRPASRRPVARWIYGDGAFSGPYDGPRYYGDPARRYRWSFLSPWTW
jgi:hypothetical protein